MRILVIEDDDRIRLFTSNGLRQEGHIVDDTPSGGDGLAYWKNAAYDLVLLDLNLPDHDGLALLKTMRQRGAPTPVIVLSARKTVDERIAGLESGADDYMTKPFSFAELLARIRVLIRRAAPPGDKGGPAGPSKELTLSGITLSYDTHAATRGTAPIPLKPKEFALLEFMMRNAGRVLTKETILHQVWDYRFTPQSNIVDALISRLRNKIDAPFHTSLIETRRGIGYVFNARP